MKFRDDRDGIAKEHASGPSQTVVVGNASASGKLEGDTDVEKEDSKFKKLRGNNFTQCRIMIS